jgi:hypothetical protein
VPFGDFVLIVGITEESNESNVTFVHQLLAAFAGSRGFIGNMMHLA